MSKARFITLIVLVVLGVIVIAQNAQQATFTVLFIDVKGPLAALLLVTFLAGVAVGVLMPFIRAHKKPPQSK